MISMARGKKLCTTNSIEIWEERHSFIYLFALHMNLIMYCIIKISCNINIPFRFQSWLIVACHEYPRIPYNAKTLNRNIVQKFIIIIGALSKEIVAEVHTIRRSTTSGRVLEDVDLFADRFCRILTLILYNTFFGRLWQ